MWKGPLPTVAGPHLLKFFVPSSNQRHTFCQEARLSAFVTTIFPFATKSIVGGAEMHENCLSQGRALIKMIGLLVCSPLVVSMAGGQQTPVKIDLEQAIQIAIAHNHALKAARTQIQQSQAQEITASLRPNPVFSADYSFLPIFSPSYIGVPVSENPLPPEFDAGVAYTIERGHKRQARIQAARDQTA